MNDYATAPIGIGVGLVVGSIAAALALPGGEVAGLAGVGVDGGQTLAWGGVAVYAVSVLRDTSRDAIGVARDGVAVLREAVSVLRDLQHDGIEHRHGGVTFRAEPTSEVERDQGPAPRRAHAR